MSIVQNLYLDFVPGSNLLPGNYDSCIYEKIPECEASGHVFRLLEDKQGKYEDCMRTIHCEKHIDYNYATRYIWLNNLKAASLPSHSLENLYLDPIPLSNILPGNNDKCIYEQISECEASGHVFRLLEDKQGKYENCMRTIHCEEHIDYNFYSGGLFNLILGDGCDKKKIPLCENPTSYLR